MNSTINIQLTSFIDPNEIMKVSHEPALPFLTRHRYHPRSCPWALIGPSVKREITITTFHEQWKTPVSRGTFPIRMNSMITCCYFILRPINLFVYLLFIIEWEIPDRTKPKESSFPRELAIYHGNCTIKSGKCFDLEVPSSLFLTRNG